MTEEEFKRIIRMQEQLSDKLDAHSTETRERAEKSSREEQAYRETHEREHRSHDKEHSEIGQWQVKKDEQLRTGASTMAELKARTKPIGNLALAGVVALVLGIPIKGYDWANEKLDTKADKAVYAEIKAKADAAEVRAMGAKMDALVIVVTRLSDKLEAKERR